MPYPNEEIDALSSEYKLSTDDKKKLVLSLSINGVQELLNNNYLKLDDFICVTSENNSQNTFIMPTKDIENIVKIFAVLKDTDLFKSNKLSLRELFFWVKSANPPFIYSVNPIIIPRILPGFLSSLKQLPEFFDIEPNRRFEYKKLEDDLIELYKLPERNRRHRALTIIENYSIEFIEQFLKSLDVNPILFLLKYEIEKPIERYLKLCGSSLREKSIAFFSSLLSENNKVIDHITFKLKKAGVQYGIILKIDYHQLNDKTTKKTVEYFIKSHNQGHTYSSDRKHAVNSNDPVDLKELFTYKIFEKLKIGPKSHFIFVDDAQAGGVYIGTQDLSFSKKHPPNTKFFRTFDQYQQAIQENKPSNETTLGIIKLDAFARIFKLSDMNEGNFGRVTIEHKEEVTKEKWKFVDFRLPFHESYNYENIINGFLAGNGTQSYGEKFKNILLHGSSLERLEKLVDALTKYTTSFNIYAEEAYLEVIAFLNTHQNDIEKNGNINSLKMDLINYKNAVIKNFDQLLNEAKLKIIELKNAQNLSS